MYYINIRISYIDNAGVVMLLIVVVVTVVAAVIVWCCCWLLELLFCRSYTVLLL